MRPAQRPIAAVAAAVAALAVLAGCFGSGGKAAPPPVPGTPAAKLPRSKTSHVVVVVMENKERESVVGSGHDAPYVNALARRYAAPTRFYGIRHPSLPNYLAQIAGSTFGVDSDCTGCLQGGRTLVDQLDAAHVSWRAYMEGMPRPCFTGDSHGRYAKKHNPFVYFHSVLDKPSRCAHVVPAKRLAGDLRAGRLPTFVWLTPDLCNDTHDCSVAHGDRYLAHVLPALLHELGPHGFLALTYDEGDSDAGCCAGLAHGGHIATVIAGPDVKRGAHPAFAYSHLSTLRTIEDAFRLPHLRDAAARGVRPLDAVFTRRPRLR